MNVAFRVFCDFLTLFSRPKEEPFGYLYYPVGERLRFQPETAGDGSTSAWSVLHLFNSPTSTAP